MQAAISRRRESLADVSAVQMTRYPPGLISPSRSCRPTPPSPIPLRRATAHLWIEQPMTGRARAGTSRMQPTVRHAPTPRGADRSTRGAVIHPCQGSPDVRDLRPRCSPSRWPLTAAACSSRRAASGRQRQPRPSARPRRPRERSRPPRRRPRRPRRRRSRSDRPLTGLPVDRPGESQPVRRSP